MAEKQFNLQNNYGWGLSLNMTGKAPEVAKRIFNTYNDAFAYADDINDSAIEGLTLTVVNDGNKNGVYFVKSARKPSVIAKLEGDDIKRLSGQTTDETTFNTKALAEEWANSLTAYTDCFNFKDENREKGGDFSGRGKICKVDSDYYEVRQIKCDTTELVKLSTNLDSQATADEVLAELNKEISARTESEKEIYSAITSAKTELNEAITAVSGDVASAKTELEESIASAKTELEESIASAKTELTETIDDVIDTIETLDDKVDAHISATTEVLDTLKIKDVVANDKVLSVSNDGKLSSTITMDYEVSGDTKVINLKGIDGEIISTIDASEFIKDGMLNSAELTTTNGKTELVFGFNVDGGTDTVRVDVTSLLNGTELDNLQGALDSHKDASNTQHFRPEERAKFDALIANFDADTLSSKFNNIQSTLTAHTNNIADLSASINTVSSNVNTLSGTVQTNYSAFTAHVETYNTKVTELTTSITNLESANTEAHNTLQNNIDGVSQAVADLESANTEAHTLLSNEISANTEAIEALSQAVADLESANTEVHETLQDNIDKVETDYQAADAALNTTITTFSGEVATKNAEIDASIADLKATKVTSVVAEENSNIVVTTSSDDNGVNCVIGFQWLEF